MWITIIIIIVTIPRLPPVDSCDRKPKHRTGGQRSPRDITPDDH